MNKPLRLVARISFLILVLVLLGLGITLAWFTSWRSDRLAALQEGSQLVETRYGRIEFKIHGDGPAVLVFHGAPGGYDQAMLFGSGLADHGFQVIAPSRPGYLRTPLGTGLTPLQEADAMAALLDSLGLESVAVLAVDAGAPAAVQFAARHPERIWALVLVSALTKRIDVWNPGAQPELGKEVYTSLTGDIGSWICTKTAEDNPEKAIGWMLNVESSGDATQRAVTTSAILKQPGQLEWFQGLMSTFAPDTPRLDGTRNDQFRIRGLEPLPFDKVKVPTLVVHGALDRGVPLAWSQEAAKLIPRGTLYDVPNTGHVVWLGPEAAQVEARIEEFLKQYSGGQSQP